WSPVWKSFSIFLLGWAREYMMWAVGQGVPALILGVVGGLMVALAALWLLCRVRVERGIAPLVTAGLAFALAVAISAGLLFGINAAVYAASQSMNTGDGMPASPILAGLPWDLNEKSPQDQSPRPRPQQPVAT